MDVPGWGWLLGGMTGVRSGDSEPRVARLALDLVVACDRVERGLMRRRKAAINEQLQDAAASVLSNVGEAWDDANPREKKRFLRYAHRSAGECQRLARGAARVGAITPDELQDLLRLLLAVKSDLRRLMGWCDRQLPPKRARRAKRAPPGEP